jgi:hypothetical protein
LKASGLRLEIPRAVFAMVERETQPKSGVSADYMEALQSATRKTVWPEAVSLSFLSAKRKTMYFIV